MVYFAPFLRALGCRRRRCRRLCILLIDSILHDIDAIGEESLVGVGGCLGEARVGGSQSP